MENQQGFFSRKLRAGKKRSYFFDVRSTKQGDFFVTITESKRRYDRPGYDSHKIYLYKEDFKTFKNSFEETLDHIKTVLNPDFDYDNYDRDVYIAQLEKDKLENPEKYQRTEKRTENKQSTQKSDNVVSEVRSGDYLDKYEGNESEDSKPEDSKENDTKDADAMNW